jgi:hypothetical protein
VENNVRDIKEAKFEKKIERNFHLEHLANVAPLIVFAYGIQCWLMMHFFEGHKLSTFAVPLAISLGLMIVSLVVYDSYYNLTLFDDHLEISFSPLGIKKEVSYADLKEIEVLDESASFSNIIFVTNDGHSKVLYFVDDANSIKEFIEERKAKTSIDSQDDQSMVA